MKRALILSLFVLVFNYAAHAQTQIEVHPCTEQGNTYHCDLHSFQQVLQATKTISIQVPARNPSSSRQLQQLATSIGKTVEPEPADLAFVLTAPDPTGVYIGPSDRKLATISVYYKASPSNPGQLIWTESYFGQPDTPWATSAHALIEQFRQNIKRPWEKTSAGRPISARRESETCHLPPATSLATATLPSCVPSEFCSPALLSTPHLLSPNPHRCPRISTSTAAFTPAQDLVKTSRKS